MVGHLVKTGGWKPGLKMGGFWPKWEIWNLCCDVLYVYNFIKVSMVYIASYHSDSN